MVVLYLLAGTAIQMLLPANVVASSAAPVRRCAGFPLGARRRDLRRIDHRGSAIGCLNGLILATGELGYAMALRGDLPAVMAKTRGINTPVVSQIVGTVLTILLLLANSSRATANLFTFIILLSTAAMIIVYLSAAMAAWKFTPAAGRARSSPSQFCSLPSPLTASASKQTCGRWRYSPLGLRASRARPARRRAAPRRPPGG